MKSPMITNAKYISEEEKKDYSELQVMRSGGGYYVGTIYHNPEGYDEPGSRESEYFKTSGEAESFLKAITEGSKEALARMRIRP